MFTAFLHEQTDPARFYGELANDSVAQLERYTPLSGRTVVDVGGGPGYFCDAFRVAGARYLGVDPDVGELSARGTPGKDMVRASGTELPVRDGAVDVCYSSNVLEHVPQPWTMLEEMCRVTKPGGIVFASYTPWMSPWGGHETAPWHFVGGDFARRRYVRKNGHEPKNRFGETLFPISIGSVLDWARRTPSAELLHAFPRYHPWWATWIVRVPGIREIASWNLALALRRKP